MVNRTGRKRVLCFGDSNTWGYIPDNGGRYEEEERYPGIMQEQLGDAYRVIEAGLRGRTTVFFDRIEPERCGIEHILPVLLTHEPIDGLVIMLGTNDTKVRFHVNASEISYGMEELILKIRNIISKTGRETIIILVAPVPLESVNNAMFNQESITKSRSLAPLYQELAKNYGCIFLDGAKIVNGLGCDGIHLDKKGHKQIGNALAEVIKRHI